jgi:alanyl-tRNA synthetase
MDATSLRQAFLQYFAARDHEIVPSASLIPHDPSVLFTIAGMVPFKPYFLGEERAPWSRATSVQKCFRTVDIDIIGTTSRHCTFFEMLGNFSFGDYFKAGAIEMAWEFITESLGIDGSRLWITVHEGDDEAEQIWRDLVGVDPSRIQRMGEDNFWRMAETGPCGPCSEIYYDKGAAYGPDGGPAYGGPERFVEVWNLVFMEFNRSADGHLDELPTKNIDTGAGLERLIPLLNGTDSIFATDVFARQLEVAQQATGRTYGASEEDDVALRIMADHGRAMTMLVADGVLPANDGRGYVLRRVVRRMVMAARRAGASKLVTPDLVASSIESLGEAYPRLVSDAELITGVLAREEEGFDRTLRAGIALLDEATADHDASSAEQLSGELAFKLHDTHGFPIELTEELVAEKGLRVDREQFDTLMGAQRSRARAAAQTPRAADEAAYRAILEAEGPTIFVGRHPEDATVPARIVGMLEGADGVTELFLDRSPFYAESGGQVGDTGRIETASGVAEVLDTVAPLGGLHAHRCKVKGSIEVGQDAVASIDAERREAIRRNHTATHLLHWALRAVLGDQVRQQGSLVAPERLRFDFSHHGAPSAEALDAVVVLVNEQILSDETVETTETSRAAAEDLGAVAFFGDKYGELVRVVGAGTKSLEFCGGTHVRALGQIGSLQIVSEGSIGSNTRRVEAVTGMASLQRSMAEDAALRSAAALLKSEPEALVDALERSLAKAKELEREHEALKSALLAKEAHALLDRAEDGALVAKVGQASAEDLRQMASTLLGEGSLEVVALGSVHEGKVALVVAGRDGIDARALVKEVGPLIGGGGGGSPQMAMAGGKNPGGLDEALLALEGLLRAR